jgi:hypothetical protein
VTKQDAMAYTVGLGKKMANVVWLWMIEEDSIEAHHTT